ncbi:MAG: tetratricopeptide repeat protein, partial [Parachlamydiaceae bacterium]
GATHPYIEYALDFAGGGMYDEAIQLLTYCITDKDNVYPMVYYTLGYFASQSGDTAKAKNYYVKASQMSPDRCFPNRIEEVNILQDAMKVNPSDSLAPYYLGNFWYAARQYDEARSCWERSMELNDKFPTVLRNLALAYYNKYDKKQEAKELLEKAFAIDTTDSRLLMELDQLYKKMGVSHTERLALLEKYPELTEQRDDLCIERITLYNQLGRYKEAMSLITNRNFHPWEGGEGKITKQYTVCRVELAKVAISDKQYKEALVLLHEIDSYPHNLGEGKLANAEENDIDYYKGIAYKGLGDEQKAQFFLQKATVGSSEPQQAFFYNDQQPDKIYYQGLAWKALGNTDKAHSRYNKLVDHGEKHLFDNCRIDYFAVSLPDLAIWEDDLNVRNQIHCYYVMGLGHLGLGNLKKAKEYLEKVRELDINHLDSQLILNNIEK